MTVVSEERRSGTEIARETPGLFFVNRVRERRLYGAQTPHLLPFWDSGSRFDRDCDLAQASDAYVLFVRRRVGLGLRQDIYGEQFLAPDPGIVSQVGAFALAILTCVGPRLVVPSLCTTFLLLMSTKRTGSTSHTTTQNLSFG